MTTTKKPATLYTVTEYTCDGAVSRRTTYRQAHRAEADYRGAIADHTMWAACGVVTPAPTFA